MGTQDDSLRHALIRDGTDFILIRSGLAQPCPDRVVVVGSGEFKDYRPRVDLRASISELFRLYRAQGGALSEWSFRQFCVLPQMKPMDPASCLCSQCEAVRHSVDTFVELLKAKPLVEFIDTLAQPPDGAAAGAGPAAAAQEAAAKSAAHEPRLEILKDAGALLHELSLWRLRLKEQVRCDELPDASLLSSASASLS